MDKIEKNLTLDTGLTQLLKGTERHFIILVGDRGYNYLPKNVRNNDIKKIKDYVTEHNGVFIHPTNEDSDEILQFDNNGNLKLVPIDGGDGDEENSPCFKTHNLIGKSKLQDYLITGYLGRVNQTFTL